MKWLDSIMDSMDKNLTSLQEIVEDRGACRATVHGVAQSVTQLSMHAASKDERVRGGPRVDTGRMAPGGFGNI